ncbi:MAG: serine/threonine-protein kinase [Gemmataceae bacterium]
MKFTYTSGQRPLDGYTIKRGVGKGGFGEVYFAVSDGGKEVALKLVRGDGDVELRGIASCLNLKHPNLVNLYDLRGDRDGNQWVVMEYVAGEPLHVVLNKHPKGLPIELAKQWFRELARAVGYLHDHGIVHRDLKPANIFIENGLLKVGDYGLCKTISNSARSAQTQSVGTVHYMAPEISTGNYGKQIDVYACGILLYEMLSGKVPFDGESAGEILMKHLTSTPDLTGLPFEFVPVVSKALAKNPSARFATMAEMVQAVEALNAPPPPPVVKAVPVARAAPPLVRAVPVMEPPTVLPAAPISKRGFAGELAGSLAMASVLSALSTVLWAALLGTGNNAHLLGTLFFVTAGLSWAVLVPSKFWGLSRGDGWGRRLVLLVFGSLVGLGVLWLDGWSPHWPPKGDLTLIRADNWGVTSQAGYVAYFGLALAAMRWWRLADRRRKSWFSLFPVLSSGFWALVLSIVWPRLEQPSLYGAAALVTASMIVQWVSPWEPPPPPSPKRLRLRYA